MTDIRVIVPTAVRASGQGAVIFSDGFEDDPSDWTCDVNLDLLHWSVNVGGCGTAATRIGNYDPGFGSEWKMGPGRIGGNAMYAWKHSSVPNGYRTEENKWLSGNDIKQEVYHRWYMRWDPAANKVAESGFKLWRYITRENGYPTAPAIYLNARHDQSAPNHIINGDLVIYSNETGFLSLANMSDLVDNTWHCHELRIKLNDNGSSNGEIQYWLDGTLEATHQNLSWGPTQDLAIHRFGVGIGNVSDSPWLNSTWAAIAFDDVVVSTGYIGL